MANHPLHPFPYHQSIIIASIAYWDCLQTLFHKHSTQIINKACHNFCLILGSNMEHSSKSYKPYRKASYLITEEHYHWYLLISIDNTIQSCSHLHKSCVRDILKLGSEIFPLNFLHLSHSNNPKAPRKTKKRKKNSHPIGKAKTWLKCHKVTKR